MSTKLRCRQTKLFLIQGRLLMARIESRLAVFQHACRMGLEGIVSKRLGSLSVRPIAGLAQVQESHRPRREAGG
jgi:hypothetical protein